MSQQQPMAPQGSQSSTLCVCDNCPEGCACDTCQCMDCTCDNCGHSQ